MKKVVRVLGENENHELPAPQMNNEITMIAETNSPRVEEDVKDLKNMVSKIQIDLGRQVNELMAWKEASLRENKRSKDRNKRRRNIQNFIDDTQGNDYLRYYNLKHNE